ncbi:hypothetical protein DFS34DRAFT_675146 [Phlyctochytrium arcticum]|nr:hypothetical protein DFS34DRAFT_675146 [Phlyctochytrium arcticum]
MSSGEPSAADLDSWADQVSAIFPQAQRSKVLVDLRKTHSVEVTINRLFDGNFLEGTHLDPSYDLIIINDFATPTRANPQILGPEDAEFSDSSDDDSTPTRNKPSLLSFRRKTSNLVDLTSPDPEIAVAAEPCASRLSYSPTPSASTSRFQPVPIPLNPSSTPTLMSSSTKALPEFVPPTLKSRTSVLINDDAVIDLSQDHPLVVVPESDSRDFARIGSEDIIEQPADHPVYEEMNHMSEPPNQKEDLDGNPEAPIASNFGPGERDFLRPNDDDDYIVDLEDEIEIPHPNLSLPSSQCSKQGNPHSQLLLNNLGAERIPVVPSDSDDEELVDLSQDPDDLPDYDTDDFFDSGAPSASRQESGIDPDATYYMSEDIEDWSLLDQESDRVLQAGSQLLDSDILDHERDSQWTTQSCLEFMNIIPHSMHCSYATVSAETPSRIKRSKRTTTSSSYSSQVVSLSSSPLHSPRRTGFDYSARSSLLSDDDDLRSVASSLDLSSDSAPSPTRRKRKELTIYSLGTMSDLESSDADASQDFMSDPSAKNKKKTPKKRKRGADTGSPPKPSMSKEEKKVAAEAKKLALERKRAERQQEKEEKARAKEQEAQAKKATRSVNTIRNKLDCIREMIVHISPDFGDPADSEELITILTSAGAHAELVPLPITRSILWRRCVTRDWDNDDECWKGCPQRIEDEAFVMICMTGGQFSATVAAGDDGILSFDDDVRREFPGRNVIYLLEGIETYLKRKGRSKHDDQANDNEVGNPAAAVPGQRRKRKISKPTFADLRNELVRLQMERPNKVLIQQSAGSRDSLEWINRFTDQIAMIPELKHRSEEAWSLTFGDKIRSGKDESDTWQCMLEQIQGISELRARAVVAVYPTVQSLYQAYFKCSTEKEGQALLAGVEVNSGTPAHPSIKKLGAALARRIYIAMMDDDPETELMDDKSKA